MWIMTLRTMEGGLEHTVWRCAALGIYRVVIRGSSGVWVEAAPPDILDEMRDLLP